MTLPERHEIEMSVESLRHLIERALGATNTRDMAYYATEAQAATAGLEEVVEGLAHDRFAADAAGVDRQAVGAAHAALNRAVERGEAVALGTDVDDMRQRVVDFQVLVEEAIPVLMRALRL